MAQQGFFMSYFSLRDASVHGLHKKGLILNCGSVCRTACKLMIQGLAVCIPTPHVKLSLGKTLNPKLFPMERPRIGIWVGRRMDEWQFIVKHWGTEKGLVNAVWVQSNLPIGNTFDKWQYWLLLHQWDRDCVLNANNEICSAKWCWDSAMQCLKGILLLFNWF